MRTRRELARGSMKRKEEIIKLNNTAKMMRVDGRPQRYRCDEHRRTQGLDDSTQRQEAERTGRESFDCHTDTQGQTGVVLLSSKRWGGRLVLPPTSETNR